MIFGTDEYGGELGVNVSLVRPEELGFENEIEH
jgi:hypothetical protein